MARSYMEERTVWNTWQGKQQKERTAKLTYEYHGKCDMMIIGQIE